MYGHSLLRPQICHTPNSYSSTNALAIAFFIDAISGSSYRRPRSRHAIPFQANTVTMSASTVTGPCKGADTRSRQIFHARPNHDEDVIVGDLQATLDAHRATNRASIIHFVQDDNETHYSYMRPTIQYISDKTQHVKNEGRTPSKRTPRKGRIIYGHWDLTGARQHRVLNFGSKKVAEYEGVYIPPTGHWSLDGNTLENMERPWLDYLRDRGGDAFSRYAMLGFFREECLLKSKQSPSRNNGVSCLH